MTEMLRLGGLFAITAVAEIVGCYLPWRVLKQGKSAWLLLTTPLWTALAAEHTAHISRFILVDKSIFVLIHSVK